MPITSQRIIYRLDVITGIDCICCELETKFLCVTYMDIGSERISQQSGFVYHLFVFH